MAKVPRPIILEINDGDDYVIVWMSPKGRMTVTSVAGNYDLEKEVLAKMTTAMTAVIEENGDEMPGVVFGVTIDH